MARGGTKHSVLVITSTPDDRTSTATLREICAELERRNDVEVSVWFLRLAFGQTPWPASRVVDDLRTWPVARIAETVGLSRLASALRGLRLRWWLRAAQPTIVVLDDGLGERVLDGAARPMVIVHRRNPEKPLYADWEAAPRRPADLMLIPPGVAATGGPPLGRVIEAPHVRLYHQERDAASTSARRAQRESLGLNPDAPLIVGWGSDGWLDGPDLFIRSIWALAERHGIVAHGLWLGLGADPHEVERLVAEADRCGIGGRYHHRPDDVPASRYCGDAVFLPYRSAGPPADVIAAAASGLVVVTFPTCDASDPAVWVVDHLDVDEAATRLSEALHGDRQERLVSACERLDVGPWTQRLLEACDQVAPK